MIFVIFIGILHKYKPMSGEEIVLPRNFVLLSELEDAEKGKYPGDCSLGAVLDPDPEKVDIYLHNWTGMIITNPNSRVGEQFVNLEFHCGDKYPDEPPLIKFTPKPEFKVDCNKVDILDGDGNVQKDKLPITKDWKRNYRMIDCMRQLKRIIELGRV